MTQRDRIVDAITVMTSENGYAPTIRELGEAVGLKSPDSVSFHLAKLRDEGRVTWMDGKSRTLRVLAVTP
jgi:repressor LexA